LASVATKGDPDILALLKGHLEDTQDVARAAMQSMLALYNDKAMAQAMEGSGIL